MSRLSQPRRRSQKGRKARKSWHRVESAAVGLDALETWPTVPAAADVVYDGAPVPLRQGSNRRRRIPS